MAEKIIYIVAKGRTIWHTKLDKAFTEGQQVDLSHLSLADIAAVIASGAVVEEKQVVSKSEPTFEKTKDVKHGKTDTN